MFGRLPLDEENKLIEQARGGSDEATEKLFYLYRPLLLAASKRARTEDGRSELYSVGCVAFMLAVRQYDKAKGSNFAAFAAAKIKGAVLSASAKYLRRKEREVEKSPQGISDGQINAAEAAISLSPVLSLLSEREQEIVAGIALYGYTRREIAKRLGVTGQRVGVIYRKAMDALRAALEG